MTAHPLVVDLTVRARAVAAARQIAADTKRGAMFALLIAGLMFFEVMFVVGLIVTARSVIAWL